MVDLKPNTWRVQNELVLYKCNLLVLPGFCLTPSVHLKENSQSLAT